MIIVRLNGGLGNQMFQFAAGYSLSAQLSVECKVDITSFDRRFRDYELNCFAGAPKIAESKELPFGTTLRRLGIPELLANTLDRAMGGMSIFEQPKAQAFIFEPRFLSLGDNTRLIGYFQSEKYFSRNAASIRNLYTLANPPDRSNKQILDQIAGTTAVSVHVRRGDYISNPHTNRFHGTCSLDYYDTAFRMLMKRVGNVGFFVFSDDMAWVRENIKPPASTVYVDYNKEHAPCEDMRLMSACKHHIIANSSFSWWAAWLNPAADKIVIAPKRWLNNTTMPLDDLFPEGWVLI
jgi:hypothetical protein